MFFKKKQFKTDKEILSSDNDNCEIKVKIAEKEQLFSAYSYSDDKLNPEFCNYIYEKAKRTYPHKKDLTIKIYANEDIDAKAVELTLKNHYEEEYNDTKREFRRIITISLLMTLFGVIALTVMVLLNRFLDNFYVTTIVEIAAWVFIWEAVDYFFLQRPLIKAKLLLIQKISEAKIETEINK